MKLSQGQRAAVQAASNAPILVLTGGPGCGKTYTTATIVKLWSAMNKHVKLAAPTGDPGNLEISTVCGFRKVINSALMHVSGQWFSVLAADFLVVGCTLYMKPCSQLAATSSGVMGVDAPGALPAPPP